MSVQQALEASQAAMTAKKAWKRKPEALRPDDADLLEEDTQDAATTVLIAAKKKDKKPKAKKHKVYIIKAIARQAWQVRVVPSHSTERNKQFSYKKTSEKKAFQDAKAHCILICARIGAALPADLK